MKQTLTVDLTHTATRRVTARELVPQVYPDHAVFASLPPVFATAFLVGFVEATCAELLHAHLEAGESSVGVQVALSHDAPTPEGMDVTAEVKITAMEGRKVTFEVTVRDAADIISTGTHTRFMISQEKFLAKVAHKRA